MQSIYAARVSVATLNTRARMSLNHCSNFRLVISSLSKHMRGLYPEYCDSNINHGQEV